MSRTSARPTWRHISGCARLSEIRAVIAALGLWLGAVAPVWAAPERVVSMNVCTDQLAMLLAAPGQLISVSHLASDPRSSAMAEEARGIPVNRGQAEEIFLLKPDLVLAGRYTARASVEMLKRLGIEVAEFTPAQSLEDVRTNLLRVGTLLDRETEAEALVAEFDARLVALTADQGRRPRAALYYANGYTVGDESLAGRILDAAGFANIALEFGHTGGGNLPLELLVLAAPELVVTGIRYRGASRSEEILDHPVLEQLGTGRPVVTGSDWVCDTPHVLDGVAALAGLRRSMGAGE